MGPVREPGATADGGAGGAASIPDTADAAAATPWGGLAWVVALVLWLTWAPFIPRQGPVDFLFLPPASVGDTAINLVLLVPAGLLLGLAADPTRTRGAALRAAAVLAGVVLLAEGGQVFVAGRHVSLFDALLNVGGGMAGWLAALRLRAAGFRPRTILLVTGSHLFFGVVVYMVAVGTQVGGGHRLDGWQDDYGIRVGGEFDAPRDYVGRVDSARICARHQGEEACAGDDADRSTRRRLARSATRGQHVELSATVRSASAGQEGPTRIVTFSAHEALRNATLGQSGRDLVLRLRTPFAGENGTGIEFDLPGAVPTGERARVRAVYDDARVSLSSRSGGRTARRSFDYRLLTVARLAAWEVTVYRPLQLAASGAVALVALFFPLGYGTELLLGGRDPVVGRSAVPGLGPVIGRDPVLGSGPALGSDPDVGSGPAVGIGPAVRLGAAALASAVAYTVMTRQLELGWDWGWAAAALALAVLGLAAAARDRQPGPVAADPVAADPVE